MGQGQSPDPHIRLDGVSFSRGDRLIFRDVSLTIPRGKVTAIMGPSGTGKTTLLRLITGQLIADRGTVELDGHEVSGLSRTALYQLRKRVGYLFQAGALLTDLDVYENVAFPLREHTRLPEALIHHLVMTRLHSVGLRGAARLMPAELSGGMARRVGLARAVVMDPELVLYDEPFAGLDPISMGVIVRLIREINQALGLTSVIVSHDIEEVSQVADWAWIIADGRIVSGGTPDELKQDESPWVRQFMHRMSDGPVPFHYPARDYAEDLMEIEP
ncbi:ABC transporter ATP-binding protein [Natronospira bacteriovora]|uniref:ATP-binding cassette domain-containing protein n=1 Tax=Natronospira bacteriovora TaxID=3069753 RepID=A0ABU0W3F6_9GAMM|nr:ATP-binding cassette domain-containing protein [Natronospira sp. AB-CW4]MDQ2068438.1 ATP-binding cassette domain-containing protein [Natronospira sp. AB-CW4]